MVDQAGQPHSNLPGAGGSGKAVLDKEDARAGYRAAIDFFTTESNESWARFNAILLANSIILAILAQLLRREALIGLPWWSFFILPGAGLLLCACWAAAISRGIQYQDYYMRAARKMEKQHSMPRVVSRGRNLNMKGFGRWRTRNTMRTVVALFVFLHLAGIGLILYKS